MKKFYCFTLILLSIFVLACGDDIKEDDGGDTGDTGSSSTTDTGGSSSYSYSGSITINRSYATLDNYDNDTCFVAAVTELDFLACSIIRVDEINVNDETKDGEEVLGEMLSEDISDLAEKNIWEKTNDKFDTVDDFLNASFQDSSESIRYVTISDGTEIELVDFLYGQLLDYQSFVDE
jgi:hypothetical protein